MFLVLPDSQAVAAHVSNHLIQLIQKKPNAVLGLATGGTMEPVYQQFVQQVNALQLDVSKLHSFNLDEYVGLSPAHPQSYNYYMHQHLFNLLPFTEAQLHLPNGLATDWQAECLHYSSRIQEEGGLDLQLLGIGSNGHIGFNEPGTSFDSRTHVVELSERTRIDNGRFFENSAEVPHHALTMGIQDIVQAREILLVVTGAHKAQTMLNYFESSASEAMPATVLKQHTNVRIIMDTAAASLLPETVLHQAA
ncbi:glucosamine-6-phosphate deaminase [Paenalcaligenes suwonensis]|uniref:glucosamine-6-phosphate deaminase n=1 Tax=Paenalcaligenes suwonensis TaxID=1202713 RepID=UPI00140B62DF|nr:glucosamine-6-phosphate deaminase [Paenalcaligenes suwonensis]NHC61716.1 glucosamine-6-phosphate deaminase [Paenalcaligenes suwonensis]